MHKLLFLLYIVLYLLGAFLCEAHIKLNVPRVRLPYFETLKVNFTLQVDTPGCYKWSVSRAIISLSSLDGRSFDHTECSDAVVISTLPRAPCCPSHAIVLAEDQRTKEIVRCDVIVDKISSISIVTTTKQIHLEEAPSKFHVRAYGNGNEFSTLEGVPFSWWAETSASDGSTSDPLTIMRFTPFYESTYQVSKAISELEARRLQGSQVLLEGLKSGAGTIFTRIADPMYKSVPPAQGVKIVVIANLVLEPSEVYVVPDTVLPLKLLQLRQGSFKEIKLPSLVYSLEVSNRTVATYDIKKSLITALSYGNTKIIVRDKNNLQILEDEEHPEGLACMIFVRDVKFLSVVIYPHRSIHLVVGQAYEIIIELFDIENQRIYIGENIKVKSLFDSNIWDVSFSSNNGTYHVATPLIIGSTRIIAELDHVMMRDGSKRFPDVPPKVQMEVQIVHQVAVVPSEVVLPWHGGYIQPSHSIRFNATGGDGNFVWSSSNYSVVVVTQEGLGRTETFGVASVTAAMATNFQINGKAKVYVLHPIDMKIIDDVVEAEVGMPILIPLAFYTVRPDDAKKLEVPFTSCQTLPFKVVVEDTNFYYDSKIHHSPSMPACAYLAVVGKTLGSSVVTVTYQSGEVSFTDSVIVSTFKPLKVVEPVSLKTVLAVGSSRQLVFQGGPRPLLERSGFFRHLHIRNTTVAQSYEYKPSHGAKDDFYVYEVICREIGETILTLETGNAQKSIDSLPIKRTADVVAICAEPSQIFFKVEPTGEVDGIKCPLEYSAAQISRIPIPNYENTNLSVVVKDPKGRKFDNITSLLIEWSASIPISAFKNVDYITTLPIEIEYYKVPGKSFQALLPKGESGNVEVTATIKGYRPDIMKKLKLRDMQLSDQSDGTVPLLYQRSYSIELEFVSDLYLSTTEITLFNHPSFKQEISVTEGSGYFAVNSSSISVLRFVYFDNNKTIDVYPENEGDDKIVIQDLCLPKRRTAEVSVHVIGVGSVEVDIVDKLEVTKETIATVRVFGKQGNFLTNENLDMIKLKPMSYSMEILEIKRIDTVDREFRGAQFKVKGKAIGQTSLIFVAESDGRISRSISTKISVFSPVVLLPRNLTMLVGSFYQFITQGGPVDTQTNFSIVSSDIASVSLIGLVEGLNIGKTKSLVQALDRVALNHVYSEDVANVNVVPFRGIRIHSPITKVLRGNEVPFWAVERVEGLDPSILLGGEDPVMTFEWKVSNQEALDIHHAFQDYGFVPNHGDQISTRLKALKAGHSTVKLIANYSGRLYIDEVEIEVFEELQLTNSRNSSYFLMTPNTELHLKTNRDATGKVLYTVHSSVDSNCIERGLHCNSGVAQLVTVNNIGIVRSFDTTGVAIILINLQEEFGVTQSLRVTVEVKPVTFLMVNPELPVNFRRSKSLAIPRGITFPMKVTYHDNIGKIFDSTNLLAKARPNRFDLIRLNEGPENNSFIVQTVAEGRTSIKILVEGNKALKDFLILSVAEAITPKLGVMQVSVGDIVCLGCSIQSINQASGYWDFHPDDSLYIMQENAIAVLLKPGQVKIEYIIPEVGSVTSTEFISRGLAQIDLQIFANQDDITNGDPKATFEVLVLLAGKTENLYGSNCNETNVAEAIQNVAPFICDLDFESSDIAVKASEIFSVKPVFHFHNRRYGCKIQPMENAKSPLYISTIKSKIILTARLKTNAIDSETLAKYEIKSSSLALTFFPGVYIHTKELLITNKQKHSLCVVTGASDLLKHLIFIPSEGSYLEIIKDGQHVNPFKLGLPEADDNFIGYEHSLKTNDVETRSFKVKLLENYWASANLDQNLFVTVISQLTKQKVKIPVRIKLTNFGAGQPEWEGWWSVFGFLRDAWSHTMSAIFVVIITLIIVHFVSKYMFINITPGTTALTESESVFVTNPRTETSHIMSPKMTKERVSFSPQSDGSGSGDTGFSSAHRLFSTQGINSNGLYGSTPYFRRTPS